MSIDQIGAEALKLPIRERALLAASLWESIGGPFDLAAERSDAEALALAIERDRQMESGEVTPLAHDELMSQLRQ